MITEYSLADLVGRTIASVNHIEAMDDELTFICEDGWRFRLYHDQDCCENVTLEDVIGDFSDITGSPITVAEEVSSDTDENPYIVSQPILELVPPEKDDDDGSQTWTFYKFETARGGITLRWYGTSNGYYSERVDLAVYNQSLMRWFD